MAYGDPTTVVASAARTTNGNSAALEPSVDGETICLQVGVTAVAGTSPSLALSLEWSNDGTNWAVPEAADTFAALNAVAQRVKTFERKAMFYRVVWAITGTTPSFTFSISEFVTN